MISGEAVMWSGERLALRLEARAGDFVYTPAGTPHLPVNASDTEAGVALVAALRAVCVLCGSYAGDRPEYRRAAVDLAEALVASGAGLTAWSLVAREPRSSRDVIFSIS